MILFSNETKDNVVSFLYSHYFRAGEQEKLGNQELAWQLQISPFVYRQIVLHKHTTKFIAYKLSSEFIIHKLFYIILHIFQKQLKFVCNKFNPFNIIALLIELFVY